MVRKEKTMEMNIKLSPEATAGLEALGRMLNQLKDIDLAFYCGEIHGRAATKDDKTEKTA